MSHTSENELKITTTHLGLCASSVRQVNDLTVRQVSDLTVRQVSDITVRQVGDLTVSQVSDLTVRQVDDLTVRPVSDLSCAHCSELTHGTPDVHTTAVSRLQTAVVMSSCMPLLMPPSLHKEFRAQS